jgi:hypothetical protein
VLDMVLLSKKTGQSTGPGMNSTAYASQHR